MPQSNTNPDWKITEKIIALLEGIITPDAKVEHNVYLPVIGSPSGRKRQCDIVITYGLEPRQSIAIVEVQKRKKMPDINTFHGWMKKMAEVGAQQLICVSALGYPNSIIEDVATNIGPTVTLMTLQDIEEKKPIEFPQLIIRLIPKFEIYQFSALGLNIPEEVQFKPKMVVENCQKLLSFDNNSDLYSIDEFVVNILKHSQDLFSSFGVSEPEKYDAEIEINRSELSLSLKSEIINIKLIDSNKLSIWYNYENMRFKIVEWIIKLTVNKEIKMKINHLKYQQELRNGTLAWIATCQLQINEAFKEIQFIFKPDKDGLLKLVVGNFQLST